jgi:hypothetical protein
MRAFASLERSANDVAKPEIQVCPVSIEIGFRLGADHHPWDRVCR